MTHARPAGRRPVPALLAALAVLLALAAVALAPGAGAAGASEEHPKLGELEGEVMCPTCKSTLDMSSSPVAERIRQFIRVRIAAGDTKSEIKDALVTEFGPAILAEPSKKGFNLLAWLLPIIGILAAAALLGWLAWRWSRGRASGDDPAAAAARTGLDPELERRLDEELRRFEA